MNNLRLPIFVVDPADMRPSDLDGGFYLTFQRSNKEPNKVRALVMDPSGAVYAKGDYIDQSNALQSRVQALNRAELRLTNERLGLAPDADEKARQEAVSKLVDRLLK